MTWPADGRIGQLTDTKIIHLADQKSPGCWMRRGIFCCILTDVELLRGVGESPALRARPAIRRNVFDPGRAGRYTGATCQP